MDLEALQRIKQWHVAHQQDHPVEYHTWDLVLVLWVTGWVGWLPALTLGAWWAVPLLAFAMSAPTLYVAWRVRAHRQRRLRCDWLAVR